MNLREQLSFDLPYVLSSKGGWELVCFSVLQRPGWLVDELCLFWPFWLFSLFGDTVCERDDEGQRKREKNEPWDEATTKEFLFISFPQPSQN